MSILEYVNTMSPEMAEDFEAHIFENVFFEFVSVLPKSPQPMANGFTPDVWTDDDGEILCRTEALANMIANALDAISGERESHTGYYDPVEDAMDECSDDHTGWWYVDFD